MHTCMWYGPCAHACIRIPPYRYRIPKGGYAVLEHNKVTRMRAARIARIRVTLLCSRTALSLGSLFVRTVCLFQPLKPNMLLLVSAVKSCTTSGKSSATLDLPEVPLQRSTRIISRVLPCPKILFGASSQSLATCIDTRSYFVHDMVCWCTQACTSLYSSNGCGCPYQEFAVSSTCSAS
jgi:hypothetical protein